MEEEVIQPIEDKDPKNTQKKTSKTETVMKNYYEDLCKAFSPELEWIRKPFCLTDDLLMSNPLVKCF